MKLKLGFLLLGCLLPRFAAAQDSPRESAADSKASITLDVVPFPPYHAAGNDVPTIFRLKHGGGEPVTLEDLQIAHTEKIHLLIIDESLTDYRHQHPMAVETPGYYRFVLRSRYGGRYSVWGQVVSKATGKTELVKGTVKVEGRPKPLERIVNSAAADHGYRYELSFDRRRKLRTGETARLKLRITKPDGVPADNLEPVMGAFGALAGFSGDLKAAILSFADGGGAESESSRGGPQLTFPFTPQRPGCWKLWVETKINGFTHLACFGVNVSEPPGVQPK